MGASDSSLTKKKITFVVKGEEIVCESKTLYISDRFEFLWLHLSLFNAVSYVINQ